MENLKIKVDKKSDVDLVVGMLVELGFELESSNVVRVGMVGTFENHIYSDYLSHFDGFDYTEKEITIDQLRDMVVLKRNDVQDATHENLMYPYVKLTDGWYYFDKGETNKWLKSTGGKQEYFDKLKPIKKEKNMKEWIYKDGSGEYVLTTDPEVANLASDAVEVPNGAETFNYFGDEGNQFFLMCSGDKVLFAYASDLAWREWGDESFDGVICLWQREKPQEKCADVRVDVGGSDVQSTLAERELQYGSFSDVAELTCDLMGDLLRDDMSFVQREALHMICSKLARIRCGDINKIDSWLDIAGYATLVVQDLEKKAVDADKINKSDNRDWVEEIEKNP